MLRALLLLVLAVPAVAQTTSQQLWYEYMLNMPFANSWNVEFASTYSTALTAPRWYSLDFQVTPEYALSGNVDVMGAIYAGTTFQNEARSTSEIREMLGARIHFTPNSRILTRLLVRLEQRNQLHREDDTWQHSTRTRIRAETVFPINKASMYAGDKLWYGIFDVEAFIVLDQDVEERFANRLRVRAGLGYRVSYGLRLELMYTKQESKNTIGGDFTTSDDIFRIRVKQFINKSKPSKAQGTGN